jgi:hypothetical protein
MLRFHAAAFSVVIGQLRSASAQLIYLEGARYGRVDPPIIEDTWRVIENALKDVSLEAKELPLSVVLYAQIERVVKAATDHSEYNVGVVVTMVKELHNNLLEELKQQLFFFVPSTFALMYVTPEIVYGAEVEYAFPEAQRDLQHGVRCFVLDEWTASVFHFMRVLEHGLRWLAEKVEIDTTNITLENWKNIIDQIVKRINAMEQLPKSADKIEDLKFYAEAAANFRFFKDAWRNHVSHARATYDANDAKKIMDHVAEFLKQLATRA